MYLSHYKYILRVEVDEDYNREGQGRKDNVEVTKMSLIILTVHTTAVSFTKTLPI